MTGEANKELIRRFVTEVFEKRDTAAVDGLVAAAFESHTWPSSGDGKASLRDATDKMSKALDEVKFTIDDLIAEGDRVVARLTASARPIAEFMGMPPTGKRYTVSEIHIFRVSEGKITEHWHQMDCMALMKQLKGE